MKDILIAIRLFIVLSIVTGIIYPLLITKIGRGLFPLQASGSLVMIDGEVKGSELIAQNFKDPRYFWPRPSAVDNVPLPSGGSNLGPTSAELKDRYLEREKSLPGAPADMLFASGSGLDPHISVASARYQMERVAQQRGLTKEEANALIDSFIEKRTLGILGEERVNVLKLNMALDKVEVTYGK